MSSSPTATTQTPARQPSAEPRGAGWPQLTAVSVVAVAATIAVAVDWGSPVRSALVLLYLGFGPGLAIVELLAIRDPVMQVALAAATSLAIETIVAVSLLYLAVYSYELAFAIVTAITALALVLAVLRAMRPPVLDEHRSRRVDA